MEVVLDLHLTAFGVICALALTCALVHFALRRGSALAWITAAMVCVCFEMLALRYLGDSLAGIVAITVLIPGAHACAAQAVRLSNGLQLTDARTIWASAGLTALSLALLAFDIAPVWQYLPFQLAGLVIFADAAMALIRQKSRDFIWFGFLVVSWLVVAMVIIRAPMFPILLEDRATLAANEMGQQVSVFIAILGVLSLAIVALVVARALSSVIVLLRSQSERDFLTGLLNRRMFDKVINRPASTAGAVIICDIDHFKSINDRFGHETGDDVIRSCADILGGQDDFVARIGGEEFALLLFDATLGEAVERAEAIRARFNSFRHPEIGDRHTMSASFGVATFGSTQNIRSALQRADVALYRAKEEGRNRVCVAEGEDVAPQLHVVHSGEGTEEPVQPAGSSFARKG